MNHTSRLKHFIERMLVICVAFCALLCPSVCANDYDTLKLKASNELIDMAEDNMRADTLWQNSIVALNIVASRYSEKSDKTTRRDAIVAMRHLGNLYLTYDVDYNKAYRYLRTACQIAEEDDDTYDLAFIYNNLANIYHWGTPSQKDRGQWIEYLAKAADAAAESKNQEAMMPIALNIINVAAEDSSLWNEYSNRIDKIAKFSFSGKYSSEGKLTRALIQGWKLHMDGNSSGAEHKFMEAKKICTDSHIDITYAYSIDILLTEILNSVGEYAKSVRLLKEMAAMSRKTDNKDYELSAYRRIAAAYREINELDSAVEYEGKYAALKSVFEKRAGFRDVRVLDFLSEIENTEPTGAMVNDPKHTSNHTTYLIVILLIGIALVGIIIFRVKRKKSRTSSVETVSRKGNLLNDESDEVDNAVCENKDYERQEEEEDEPEENVDGNDSERDREETEEELSAVYSRIIEVMVSNKEVYQPGFSLPDLAGALQLPRSVVSKAINSCHGTNFHQLLNEYRIKKLIELIDSGQASNYTIETLAQSVGFKSRPSFVTLFKKKVGVSPSEYIRQADRD